VGEFWRLVGATLLGALISFGTTFYFERRKEQRSEQAEEQENQRKLQQAARLVWDELLRVSLAIGRAIEGGVWWSRPPHDFERLAWVEYQATLARLLNEQAWTDVSGIYSLLAIFNVQLAMAREGVEVPRSLFGRRLEPISGSVVSDAWKGEIGALRPDLDDATKALNQVLDEAEASGKNRTVKHK
jgi:hypothetical protein